MSYEDVGKLVGQIAHLAGRRPQRINDDHTAAMQLKGASGEGKRLNPFQVPQALNVDQLICRHSPDPTMSGDRTQVYRRARNEPEVFATFGRELLCRGSEPALECHEK